SEAGTKLVDGNGAEHTLTERGALMLQDSGACRLALAVSVDGEEPGVSDRACTWQVVDDRFFLGDASGSGTRTVYQVKRQPGRLVLEGMSDVDPEGKVVGKGQEVSPATERQEEGADAVVAFEAGEAAGVRVADCVPVLLYAEDMGAAAAVHSGWRGSRLSIAGRGVRALQHVAGADP